MDLQDIVIREMKVDDLDSVMTLENLCFFTPWSKEAFESELLRNKLAHYIVLLINNIVVGYGGVWYIVGEGHITNVAIHSEYRKLGLGKQLVEQMKQNALKNKIKLMTLEVRVSNIAAIKLYEKMGFNIEGIRPKYYIDTNEDAYIMWVDLLK